MKQYHKNPRKISQIEKEQLAHWLSELGDLSGIVHDLNSDEIIGGNQRSAVFDVNKCEIELVSQSDEPDEQGTVAHGFVIWNGRRYAYRQVRWTPKQCEKANIVANNAGGEWDDDLLASAWDLDDLASWGFSESAIDDLATIAEMAFSEPGDNYRELGKNATKIKPVLHVEQVEVFERAIKATGLANRGDAVIEICKAYLNEKGQFDFEIESLLEA